eukprot:scaffold23625_cov137-Cylindrotheca_fusiformis.AAC.18
MEHSSSTTAATKSMDVDDGPSPKDASFVESLTEPWKSIASKVIPLDDAESPLESASERLEQLEIDCRSHIFEVLKNRNQNIAEAIGDCWKTALNLCFHLVYYASSNPKDSRYTDILPVKLPLLLIEDCFDGLTITECKQFWEKSIEPAFDILFGDLLWDSSNSSRLQFLRVCNQFLSRMEPTDFQWKGRVMMALAEGFPIADRSALKMWGHFHSSDNNDFETEEEFQATDKSSIPTASPVDYSLYRAFWSLQNDFSNPNRIQLAGFINKMKIVLDALESAASNTEAKRIPSAESQRYLTSSSLFLTQLGTAKFRTSVVSQFLIVAAHLSAESPSLASALSTLLLRARKLLQTDNEELYKLLWDAILSKREVQWRKWKKESKCAASAFAPKRTLEEAKSQQQKKRTRLLDGKLGEGNDRDDPKQYEIVKRDELAKIALELSQTPTLEEHLEEYVDALDPGAGIEEEYHPKNDPMFSWRAMRLFAKHQLPLLKHCRKPADLERMTRQWYLDQGKVIPGEMPASDPESDEESTNSKGSTESRSMKQESEDGRLKQNDNDEASAKNDGDETPAKDDVTMEDADAGSNSTDEAEERTKKESGDEAKGGASSPENNASLNSKDGLDTKEDEGMKDTNNGDRGKTGNGTSEANVEIETEEADSVASETSVKQHEDPDRIVRDGKDEAIVDQGANSNPSSRQESGADSETGEMKGDGERVGSRASRSTSRDRSRSSKRSTEKSRESGSGGHRRDRSANLDSKQGRSDDGRREGRRDDRFVPGRSGRRDDRYDDGQRGGRRDERYGDGHRGGTRGDRSREGRRDDPQGDGPRSGRRDERFIDGHRGGRGGPRGGRRGDGRGGSDRRDERRGDDRRRRGIGGRGRR